MATALVECWKCEECGHRWIKTAKYPPQCTSSKCRSRKWNLSAGVNGVKPDTKSPIPTPTAPQTFVPENAKSVGYANKPDMQALRDICAGKLPGDMPKGAIGYKLSLGDEPIIEVEFCGKTWWEDGEQYECLMDKGHKFPKHGMSGMVRVVD